MRRLRERIKLEDARVHDFRKCLTTWLAENGVSRDVRKAILHHAPEDVTDAHYTFAQHETAVRSALRAWGDHIAAVVAKQEQQERQQGQPDTGAAPGPAVAQPSG
jgi:integrase